jgi:hypothetical protein
MQTAAARTAVWIVLAALALAALSLLLPWALAFDPQMWLVWGRGVTRLALDTRAGPSWKPGPVIVTTPLSLLGSAAPALWLIAARAGALLALAGAFVLGRRLAGVWAGVAAALTVAVGPWWLENAALGNSEGILAAAVLWAAVAHLAGRRRAAFGLLFVAALLRPEAWPFLGLYGLWLWREEPRAWPLVVGLGVLVPVLWLVPSALAGGGALGAANAARGTPSTGSAGLSSHPVATLLWDAVKIAGIPAFVAAAIALALAARRRDGDGGGGAGRPVVAALALAAVGWVAIVAAMTAAGYAGNPRYLVAAAAVFAVLAGAGAVGLAGRLRLPAALALAVPVLVGLLALGGLRSQMRDVGVRAERREALPQAIADAGGRDALLRCAKIRTASVVRGLVAWELDVPAFHINSPPAPPDVVLQMRPYDGSAPQPAFGTGGYRRAAARPGWTIWSACG